MHKKWQHNSHFYSKTEIAMNACNKMNSKRGTAAAFVNLRCIHEYFICIV